MNRTEYLNTRFGQWHENFKRQQDIVEFVINQEPKSKNGIHKNEVAIFREEVINQLKQKKRRAYRGSLVLEIEFHTTKNDPPSVHNLTKNYLDLLHKEMPKIDRRKHILFKDDSQIKLLIAELYYKEKEDEIPLIKLKTYRYSHFAKDLELVRKISTNNFTADDYDDDNYKEEIEENHIDPFGHDLFDNFNLEFDSKWYIEKVGYDLPSALNQSKERHNQGKYLSSNRVKAIDLAILSLNDKHPKSNSKYNINWDDLFKNLIFITSDQINLGETPTKIRGKKIVKTHIKDTLKIFKDRHPNLIPLFHPIGITVIFKPAKNNILDLDNLARYVLPIVNEIFQPPIQYRDIPPEITLRENEIKYIGTEQRIPKNGIMSYQVLKLERDENTPLGGSIDVIIGLGRPWIKNFWMQVQSYIWNWRR
jgi:Holliday junction resolvase RusA-like endonuclease